MDSLAGLINELLALALQAFSLFVGLLLTFLEFFVVIAQSILNIFHQ